MQREGSEYKKKGEKQRLKKKEREKQKNCIDYKKKKIDCCASSEPSIYMRVNLFIPQKLI